jgi:hypothetical protein
MSIYQGKSDRRSHRRSVKPTALLVSLLLILCVTVGGTIAFLMDTDGPLDNLFNTSQVTTEVVEKLEDATKSDVSIKNTGDTEAWICAAVVVTWQDADGNVYGTAPAEDTDYEIVWGTVWLKGADGFYYWPSPVAPNGVTGDLIETCTYKSRAPAGYFLNVEIIGSGIQSKPAGVFDTEWASSGLHVQGDKLVQNP